MCDYVCTHENYHSTHVLMPNVWPQFCLQEPKSDGEEQLSFGFVCFELVLVALSEEQGWQLTSGDQPTRKQNPDG